MCLELDNQQVRTLTFCVSAESTGLGMKGEIRVAHLTVAPDNAGFCFPLLQLWALSVWKSCFPREECFCSGHSVLLLNWKLRSSVATLSLASSGPEIGLSCLHCTNSSRNRTSSLIALLWNHVNEKFQGGLHSLLILFIIIVRSKVYTWSPSFISLSFFLLGSLKTGYVGCGTVYVARICLSDLKSVRNPRWVCILSSVFLKYPIPIFVIPDWEQPCLSFLLLT